METQTSFGIVAGVLQRGTLTPYVFIICLDNVLQTLTDFMKENDFTIEKARSRWYLTQTIMDADYADDTVLLANTPAEADSLLHSLEQATNGIDLHGNADKMEYMGFNQIWYLTLNGGSLKLVDKFTYFGSSISSMENDINMQLAKVRTAPIK